MIILKVKLFIGRPNNIEIRKSVINYKPNLIILTMRDIWEEHHRRMREIDERYKRKSRNITVRTMVILLIAVILYLILLI